MLMFKKREKIDDKLKEVWPSLNKIVKGRVKKEIIKLDEVTSQKGCTLPCLRMYWKGGRVKVEIGVGKGKTHSDQRQDLKKRTEMREVEREISRFNRR